MLAYRCNVEFILSIIVFCFKILGIGALFGHNMLIFFFCACPILQSIRRVYRKKAEQIFKEAAVIH